MLKHLHEHPDPDTPDLYERAFVHTVLRLNGVRGNPTEQQIVAAIDTFHRYSVAAARVRAREHPLSDGWLQGRTPEPAAMEQAFLFVRYHSVLLPNAGQIKAFNDWLLAGTLH